MKKDIWKNFEFKITMILLAIVISLGAGIYFVKYYQYYTLIIEGLKEEAINVHRYAEEVIDERSFFDLNVIEDEESDLYISAHNRLDEIRRIANILYLYTAKRTEDGRYIYVVDGLSKDDELFRHVGDPIEDEIISMLSQCLNDEIILENKILDTEWGVVYVAYFPFHDSKGNVIGAIGMEFDCENVYKAIKNARLITILFSIFIASGFMVVSFFIIRKVIRSTQTVFSDMEKSVIEASERTMLMLDTSPLCIQVWDKHLNTIDCNEAGVRLYGFKDKQEYIDRFLECCSPEYQPDGQRSDEKAVMLVNKAFKEGYCNFEWMHRRPIDDIPIPAEITLVRAKYKGEDIVLGYTRDMREQKKMMKDIEYRDNLMQAVNQAAMTLLNSDMEFFEKELHRSMNIIAEAVKVDCVYLWKNHTTDGKLFCSQVFEWSPQKTIFADGTPYSYDDVVPGWEEILSGGRHINNIVRNMSQKEQEHLSPSGILSILVVPIFIKDQFWGFVGFDDCHRERIFTKEEESNLHSASLMLANSFIRNEMIHDIRNSSEQLKRRAKLMQAVNQSATLLLTTKDNEDIEITLTASMELVGSSMGVDRVNIWRSEMTSGDLQFLHAYCWLSDTGKQKTLIPKSIKSPFGENPEWEDRFSRIGYISGPVSQMPQDEQAYFAVHDIKSVVVIPLFLDEQFWGLFSVDDCTRERNFTEDEITILKSVSLMMVSAINRHSLVAKRTHQLALQTTTLTTLFDSIPDMIFTKDSDSKYMHCNKAFLEFFDKRLEDVLGKNIVEALGVPEESAKQYNEEDQKVMRENQKIVIEEPLLRDDGTTLFFETIKLPLMLDNAAVGIMGISRDVTKLINAERAMAANYEHVRRLGEALTKITKSPTITAGDLKAAADVIVHDGCIVLNTTRISVWKLTDEFESLENISCYDNSIGEYINEVDFNLLIHPEYTNLLRSERLIVINDVKALSVLYDASGDGYTPNVCAMLDAPIRVDGRLIGVICAEQDCCEEFPDKREWRTGEKNFVSSLADLMALAFSGAERRKARDEAEQANKTKSSFLANMSHEIRTPMNSVIGFTELALDGENSPKTKDYLARIKSNAEWLLQIINDILDISKIESGKMELEQIPFDLHELFSGCRASVTPRASEKNLELHFYAEPSFDKIPLGDPTRLRQVLVNLLSNAIKFTNTGVVKLSAVVKEVTEKNITLHFEVKDSGIGMTPEQIARIFDPFVQAESGTTRKYGGSGLGLTIVKNIVEMMGGTLSIKSMPGVGSMFGFKLTFDTIDMIEGMLEKKTVLKEFEKPVFQGEILVCEDNAMNQQVIYEHLTRIGFGVVVAENGKIGLEQVQSRMKKNVKQFDLIFMDMHMPVMDGLEAAIKIIELDSGIPIVAMTANIMSSDIEIYKKSGMRDYVGKPFTSQELWHCLMKYFKPIAWQPVNELQQTQDKNELQQKLINSFVKNNRNKYDDINEAISAGDIKLAHRLAHTLKSNAGQLGKAELKNVCEEIEAHLTDGKNRVKQQMMMSLERELNKALAELTPLVYEPLRVEKPPAAPLDESAARELIEKLEPLLEQGNLSCLEFIGDLQRVPGSEDLIRQIEDYEFEKALILLAELKEKYG